MVYYAVLLILILNVHFIDGSLIIVINKSINYFDTDVIKTMWIEQFSSMIGSGRMWCSFKSYHFSSHSTWIPKTEHLLISIGKNTSCPALLPYQTRKEIIMPALHEEPIVLCWDIWLTQ